MGATAFMVDPANRLTELQQAAYDNEALLQGLLSDHPDLLRCISGVDGRLLLLKREAAVPDCANGGRRWSLDHLFVDRQGVPVLVEVKRASDTRARREVVAQMLDYAANGIAYWPIESTITAFEASTEAHHAVLADFLGDSDVEGFWRTLEANLRAGHIRMVFVADRIPPELRRIVEFLNEQMRPAEVLAVEVDQHVTRDGLRLLTPVLVGATERAVAAKSVRRGQPLPMTEEEWLDALSAERSREEADVARRVADWFRDNGFRVGVTTANASLYAGLESSYGQTTWPFFVRRSSGMLETNLRRLKDSHAYASDDSRALLLARLRAMPGVLIKTDNLIGSPAIPLAALAGEPVWQGFTAIASEVRDRLTG
jgi:hypothetical protein